MEIGLTFLHWNHLPRCNAVIDKFFEGYATLQFMEQGAIYLSYGEDEYSLRGSWFWPAFPGPRIRFGLTAGQKSWNHRHVALRGPRLAEWMSEGLWSQQPQQSLNGARDAEYFDEILAYLKYGDALSMRLAANCLEGTLLRLIQARAPHEPTEPRDVWLRPVLEEMERDGNFMPDYEHLARQHGMALSTLRRRFREIMGVPLHEYAIRQRMARAREMLDKTDEPLKNIAEQLGYSDLYFFARQFKQQTGVSPANYRKNQER